MVARCGYLVNKWTVTMVLAVLAAVLATALPAWAQNGNGLEKDHPENGADPVATFTAVDPEGRTVYWDLLRALPEPPEPPPVVDGVALIGGDLEDHDNFSISMDGVLTFKSPPDFETMRGGGIANDSNTYNVVVVSSDDAPGAGDMIMMDYHKVTVTVTDVDEDGSISLSTLQPQVDVPLTATLTDQDARSVPANPIINAVWKWEQSPATDGPWTLIPGAGDEPTLANNTPGSVAKASDGYTPVKATAGMYLQATVTYTDEHGDDKTAMAVLAHPVRTKPAGTNATPSFPDENSATPGTIEVSRKVKENAPPGTLVGKPVVARDAGDILTYRLSGSDSAYFSINRATGQITVKKTLNFEADADADGQCTLANACVVTVTATDPWGITASDGTQSVNVAQTVNITVEDVNEAPKVSGGPTKTKQRENSFSTDATPGDDSDTLIVTTYKATDPESDNSGRACNEAEERATEGSICTWSLEGDDAPLFEISNEDADENGRLTFKEAPNFEAPVDADEDNIYEVIVKVTDSGVSNRNKMSATRNVMIIVTNVNENGMVEYSSVRPKVGIPFTASLSDPDGDTTDVEWAWKRTITGVAETPVDCTGDSPPAFAMDIDEDSDTYTPKSADLYQCLEATATYTDPYDFGRTRSDPSKTAVIINNDNVAPEFREGLDKPVMQATRSIEENSPDATATPDAKTSDVGPPVVATDPNGGTDTAEGKLTYTLDGRDKDSFEIDRTTGQITVKEETKLDYEKKKSYMVTVTATDPSRASTTIDVAINVTNEDEAPVIAGEDVIKDYPENGTASVARFTAKDPEGRKVYWSLDNDGDESPDAGDFKISSNGELHFMSAPDFDGAVDSDIDNVYVVRVTASDDAPGADSLVDGEAEAVSGETSMKKVTVTVTNKDETGTLTITPRYPDTADTLTAVLADEDSDSLNPTWKWNLNGRVVEGQSLNTYDPADNATGSVMVEVIYSDGLGSTSKRLTAATTVIQAVDPNPAPEFTDGDTTTREVSENRHPATVGAPVRAMDTGIHNGKLGYSVLGDDANFTVDLTTGQLRTKGALDYETATTNGTESVIVTVIDPAGATDTITVTVRVKDVNEAPTITRGPTMKMLDEDDVDTDVGDVASKEVGTYTAKDPESTATGDVCDAASCTWSLRGTDAEDFMIADGTDGTTFGALTFKEFPNYDIPVDSNRDNVYMVTVVLTDKGNTTATRDVAVMVQDVEETGVVTFSAVQPKVGIPFTASLDDDDGDVTDVTWQWASQASSEAACPIAAAPEDDGWVNILGAKDATYTPKASDVTGGGLCLQATATYADRRGPGQTALDVSANDVSVNNDNRGPVFKKNGQEITEDTRYIAEKDRIASDPVVANSDGKTVSTTDPNTVDPVMATDPNGDDLLTYTLGGPDASLFKITDDTSDTTDTTRGGQISLKTADTLNYEDKNTYMVKVTAADPDGLSDSVDVTIKVTDVDEAPKIKVGGLAISAGPTNPDHPENSTASVGTYTVVGSMKDSASWTLTGNDASHFMVQPATGMSVMLMFKTAPDHEMPGDANMDNVYEVSVEATDSESKIAMRAVTITVTNEEEMGEVTLWAGTDALTMAPQVGDTITGAVMDPDGGVMVESWQWSRTMTPAMMDSWMDIQDATDAAYMVAAGDVGYYLRVMATYTDAAGTDMVMEYSPATMMVTMMVTMNAAPMFDSETGTREVPENTAAGELVGAPVTAMDADAGDTLTYTLGGTDAASFDINPATGQITVGAGTMLDFEATQNTYMVTVTASDGTDSDSIDVTITVTDVDEGMPMDLLTRYDDNKNNVIDLPEVFRAIDDYFDYDDRLTLAEVYEVVDLYFES